MSLRRTGCFIGFFTTAILLLAIRCSAQKDSSGRKNHILILPVISRSIETSWSFGAVASSTFHINKKDSTIRTSNAQALVLYSLKKQFIAALNGTIYFPGEKYILTHQMSYSFFPDKFWGLGKSTPDSAAEPYDFRQFYIYLHGQRALARHLFIGVVYEYQDLINISYLPGGLFDKENVAGRYGYHVSGLGASLTYDTRNNAFAPDKGVFLQGSFNHFANFFGSNYTYTNYVIDARGFIKTHNKQVLALQAYAFLNNGDVPLRSLASFGGANSMRGYYDGRFRDKNQVIFQTEYRVPIYRRLGAVAFGGVGNVGDDSNVFSAKDVKYSYGGGVRIALSKSEKLNLRLDYGIGRGGHSQGFYFQLGEAF